MTIRMEIKMKYIIVNSVKNGNCYLRKENKKTRNTISNTKCVHLVDFAKEVVIKYMAKKGMVKALDVLDSTSGAVLLYKILEENLEKIENLEKNTGNTYFVSKESLSRETVQEIWQILSLLRMGAKTIKYEESKDIKITQIKELIESYEDRLQNLEIYDVPLLYKRAIEILESDFTKKQENENLELDFVKKQEDENLILDFIKKQEDSKYVISDVCMQKLTAVELEFLQKYTKGNYEIFPFLSKQEGKTYLKDAEFMKAYGISNEVSGVISRILEKDQKFGEIEILYSSAEYEPFLEAQLNARNISYAMTNRQLPADNPYLYMMKYILEWAKSDFTYET